MRRRTVELERHALPDEPAAQPRARPAHALAPCIDGSIMKGGRPRNGFVHAKVHDVVAPPVASERYSVAFFLGSRPDAVIPPDALKEAERGISADPLNPIFREVGQNQLKSRLRSHPDVARVHYADLLERERLSLGD